MEVNELQNFLKVFNGNSDLITQHYYDSLVIESRLIDSDLSDITLDFCGHRYATPVMLGVIGGWGQMGEKALFNSAEAARQLDTVLWVSSYALKDNKLEKLIATGAKIGYVCKPHRDQLVFLNELKRVSNTGIVAVAVDIDHAYGSDGEYDKHGGGDFGPKSVAQLKEAVEVLSVPLFTKGVLSVHDALKSREAGCAGCFISHHHNIIKSAIPPVMILPQIREAVGDEFTLIVDCGIKTGVEAFKALALGAEAVCVARGYMPHLVKEGTEGVVSYINKVTGETRELLNRTGSKDLKSIDPGVIHRL